MKSKKQRANHKSYMTKALRKAIMKRSELATKYHKTKTIEDYKNYKKQRNFSQSFIRKRGKNFMTIWTLKALQIIRNFGKHSNHFCVTKQNVDPLKLILSKMMKFYPQTKKLLKLLITTTVMLSSP